MRHTAFLVCAFSLLIPSAARAVTVFQDTFTNGSTLNSGTGGSYPTPTSASTGYNILSTKGATTGPSLTSGNLRLSLNAATTSGVIETQALVPSVTRSNPGDVLNYTIVFVNTSDLLAAGASSYFYAGLYNSGGVAPLILNNSGLNTTAGSIYATGGAFGWQGYVTRTAPNGGSGQIYTRPVQSGVDTSSQNQDVVGNNAGGGLYDSPAGTTVNQTSSTMAALTNGNTYTYRMSVTLNGDSSQTFVSSLFDGGSASGTPLFTQSGTAATPLTSLYDAIAIGYRTAGSSLNPVVDLKSVTLDLVPVPEPASLGASALAGVGVSLAVRRRKKA